MRASRSNLLFAFLIGALIGLFIRRHRERKATNSPTSTRREHAELIFRWQDKRPNSIV